MVALTAPLVRFRLAVVVCLALTGCAVFEKVFPGSGGARATAAAERLDEARLHPRDQARERAREKAVAAAERALARNPGDPALRSTLGRAYLAAGRPGSAARAFEDALALGDASVATIVGLALGRIAIGEGDAAVRLLDERQASVPASDRGLALALAGETARGVAVLAQALRQGEGGSRLRQNLAFSYALDGRWREAARMAAQDLPPDRVRARLLAWARLGRPETVHQRVGYVLGVRLRADEGYPPALALRPAEAAAPGGQLAAAASP